MARVRVLRKSHDIFMSLGRCLTSHAACTQRLYDLAMDDDDGFLNGEHKHFYWALTKIDERLIKFLNEAADYLDNIAPTPREIVKDAITPKVP